MEMNSGMFQEINLSGKASGTGDLLHIYVWTDSKLLMKKKVGCSAQRNEWTWSKQNMHKFCKVLLTKWIYV